MLVPGIGPKCLDGFDQRVGRDESIVRGSGRQGKPLGLADDVDAVCIFIDKAVHSAFEPP